MKAYLLLIGFCALFAVACKKKNPDPVPAKANHALSHSGMVDSVSFNLDTTAVTPQLTKMSQWDGVPYKVFSIETWLRGPHLDVPVQAGEERLSLSFSFLLQYSMSEYDSDCNCFPVPSASRVVNHINNTSSGWNDSSEKKMVFVRVWNDQYVTASFQIGNAQIAAQTIGNSVRIYGTIDSLKVESSPNPARYLTDLEFDYTVPISL